MREPAAPFSLYILVKACQGAEQLQSLSIITERKREEKAVCRKNYVFFNDFFVLQEAVRLAKNHLIPVYYQQKAKIRRFYDKSSNF